MKSRWTGRMTQAAAKYGEHAPMAAACCNSCRACTTTNLIGLATGGAIAAFSGVARFTRRIVGSA